MTPEQQEVAAKIIRAFAAEEPIGESAFSGSTLCTYCDEFYYPYDGHAADCPWRLAVELAAELGEPVEVG